MNNKSTDSSKITIEPAVQEDFADWLPLWKKLSDILSHRTLR